MVENDAPALELRGVQISYPDGFVAVDGADLELASGEILALLGPSGSGKSTLLRGIAGLERVTAGEIRMRGRAIDAVPVHRRNIGMVFQDGQLFPHRSVGRNIAYGLEGEGRSRQEIRDRVEAMLALVGLEGFGGRSVQTLSGGQAQRVALARSLAREPELLLLDEPLSALDRALRERLADELRRILAETGTSAVHVTHDESEAERIADRTMVIREGRLSAR
ncbi:ABC transporter ATP-binding protein [Gulosibacter sp. 10]|uniref:ABC transporter ATP-binding protein n=1 Tax=Gulosibacter sp. 10 TaxID=1255570 RepID=UPI00097EB9B1|nr:ABC transporter ATP-binding protein [Gulosibacter sp. 10]SJM51253.1 ABC transporter ATP-binding protein [Gulosibacter sp. 10]